VARGIPDEIRNLPVKERAEAIRQWNAQQKEQEVPKAPASAPAGDKPLVDSIPEDMAPKRTRSTRAKKDEAVPPYKPGMFVEPVMQAYAMVGMGISMFDKHEVTNPETGKVETIPLCGQAIVQQAEAAAIAWDKAAQKDPRIRKALQSLVRGSVWGGIAAAHLPIVMTVIGNHMPGLFNGHQSDDDGNAQSS
jgi:hypothetical protein